MKHMKHWQKRMRNPRAVWRRIYRRARMTTGVDSWSGLARRRRVKIYRDPAMAAMATIHDVLWKRGLREVGQSPITWHRGRRLKIIRDRVNHVRWLFSHARRWSQPVDRKNYNVTVGRIRHWQDANEAARIRGDFANLPG